ncbi:phage terminase small subunit P27 family [Shouchella patagoniensis]|uniref:phage terminase small subunit P27 family n=1 Tax=Shouchella patagoniensis TaxID=228576 RepID=UPI000995A25D|nr:phage terminase small subunit P27 family [Shouchella patagoniensis]
MGRNAKSMDLHVISGNKAKLSKEVIEQRKQAEDQLTFKDDDIKAPDFLSERGNEIFENLLLEFQYTQILKNVDSQMLGLYCDAMDRYLNIKEQIEHDGLMPFGKPHQLLSHQDKAFERAMKVAGRFGLSPSDRAKLALSLVTKVDKKDPDDNGFGDRT